MKVYFNLREKMKLPLTLYSGNDQEFNRTRRNKRAVERVFYHYSGCNTQVSEMICKIDDVKQCVIGQMQACSIITEELPETRNGKSLFDAVVASLPILRYLNNILNNASL